MGRQYTGANNQNVEQMQMTMGFMDEKMFYLNSSTSVWHMAYSDQNGEKAMKMRPILN